MRERVKAATGVDDACPVMGEAFIQWVIEDHFIAGRPAWEKVGAELVDSVMPYEEAKIRILNATHSCIAWAGTLVGLNYIHEGTLDADINKFAYEYVTEDVIPCLTPSPLDLERYRDVVLERFSNPYIQDTNQRVAADGFSKLPGFIAPTLSECFERGVTPAATAMLPALFFRFLDRWNAGKLPYAYQDGVMDERVRACFLRGARSVESVRRRPAAVGQHGADAGTGIGAGRRAGARRCMARQTRRGLNAADSRLTRASSRHRSATSRALARLNAHGTRAPCAAKVAHL